MPVSLRRLVWAIKAVRVGSVCLAELKSTGARAPVIELQARWF